MKVITNKHIGKDTLTLGIMKLFFLVSFYGYIKLQAPYRLKQFDGHSTIDVKKKTRTLFVALLYRSLKKNNSPHN